MTGPVDTEGNEMLVLRAWVLYWRVRYGFRANVTGGTFIRAGCHGGLVFAEEPTD